MSALDAVTDPAVWVLLTAINDGDRDAFFAALAPDAVLTDDGSERDLNAWVDREIFTSNGHIEVESATDAGRSLIANYSNDTWGAMRTRWSFTVDQGKISRIDTGQA